MLAQRRAILSVLIELGILFLPGIPMYLWVWGRIPDAIHDWAIIGVYFYFISGGLFIGLRRWDWNQLGFNRQGIALSLLCGLSLFAVLFLGRLALNLPFEPQPPTLERIAYDIFFYIGLVGIGEELLFRGVLYRTLDEWRGARWAICGTAMAFGLYHVGGQGIIGGLGTAVIGLYFALIRWRAGGIVGLILVHGLYDIVAIEGWGQFEPSDMIARFSSINRPLALVCDAILLLTLLYLWKIHPRLMKNLQKQ